MDDMIDKINGAINQMVYGNDDLFKGDVVCPKCGESHDHEGILEECECTRCGADLTGVLF